MKLSIKCINVIKGESKQIPAKLTIIESYLVSVKMAINVICSGLILVEKSDAGEHLLRGHDSVSQ